MARNSARDTDLIASLDHAAMRMVAASADALRAVVACNDAQLWRRDGATSMTSWLAARYRLTRGSAREWVRVGYALTRLPRIAAEYEAGRLSWDQLRPLTRFATADNEGEWADRASSMPPARLYLEAKRHERVRADEVQDAHHQRGLSMWLDDRLPVLWLQGNLPADQGVAVKAALERRAEEVVFADSPAIPHEARLADALVELVTGAGESEAAPATLVVHASAEVLAGVESNRGPWLAETEAGERLDSESIRRLACDARIEWVIESHGRAVGIGRRGRQVRGTIARLLRHRDRGCRFPGCQHQRWLKAHHLVHWGHGGTTDLDNLVLLCHAHHRLVHEGGWSTSGHPERNLRFHDPGGLPLRTMPTIARRRALVSAFP